MSKHRKASRKRSYGIYSRADLARGGALYATIFSKRKAYEVFDAKSSVISVMCFKDGLSAPGEERGMTPAEMSQWSGCPINSIVGKEGCLVALLAANLIELAVPARGPVGAIYRIVRPKGFTHQDSDGLLIGKARAKSRTARALPMSSEGDTSGKRALSKKAIGKPMASHLYRSRAGTRGRGVVERELLTHTNKPNTPNAPGIHEAPTAHDLLEIRRLLAEIGFDADQAASIEADPACTLTRVRVARDVVEGYRVRGTLIDAVKLATAAIVNRYTPPARRREDTELQAWRQRLRQRLEAMPVQEVV